MVVNNCYKVFCCILGVYIVPEILILAVRSLFHIKGVDRI